MRRQPLVDARFRPPLFREFVDVDWPLTEVAVLLEQALDVLAQEVPPGAGAHLGVVAEDRDELAVECRIGGQPQWGLAHWPAE